MSPTDIDAAIDAKLASLGGHLLAKYGHEAQHKESDRPQALALATLGGYLLEEYTQPAAGDKPYRDPQPPAVGEPPTTIPAGDDDQDDDEPETEHVEGTKPT